MLVALQSQVAQTTVIHRVVLITIAILRGRIHRVIHIPRGRAVIAPVLIAHIVGKARLREKQAILIMHEIIMMPRISTRTIMMISMIMRMLRITIMSIAMINYPCRLSYSHGLIPGRAH